MLIYCFVYNASEQQCLFALNAGCALTAVVLTSLVARPCLGVVDRELLSASRYGSFRQEGVGCMHLDVSVRALMHSVAHGSDESLAAVGINMVVASVVGNHHSFEASALRYATGYGEHDAIAKGHNGRCHVVCTVRTLGNGICT